MTGSWLPAPCMFRLLEFANPVLEEDFQRFQRPARLLNDRTKAVLGLLWLGLLVPDYQHYGLQHAVVILTGLPLVVICLVLTFFYVDVWFRHRTMLTSVSRLWLGLAFTSPGISATLAERVSTKQPAVGLLQYILLRTDLLFGVGLIGNMNSGLFYDIFFRIYNGLLSGLIMTWELSTVLVHLQHLSAGSQLCNFMQSFVRFVHLALSPAAGAELSSQAYSGTCVEFPLLTVAVFTHFYAGWGLYFYRYPQQDIALRMSFLKKQNRTPESNIPLCKSEFIQHMLAYGGLAVLFWYLTEHFVHLVAKGGLLGIPKQG